MPELVRHETEAASGLNEKHLLWAMTGLASMTAASYAEKRRWARLRWDMLNFVVDRIVEPNDDEPDRYWVADTEAELVRSAVRTHTDRSLRPAHNKLKGQKLVADAPDIIRFEHQAAIDRSKADLDSAEILARELGRVSAPTPLPAAA